MRRSRSTRGLTALTQIGRREEFCGVSRSGARSVRKAREHARRTHDAKEPRLAGSFKRSNALLCADADIFVAETRLEQFRPQTKPRRARLAPFRHIARADSTHGIDRYGF